MPLDWREPPVTTGAGSGFDWSEPLAELRTRPGEWAMIRSYDRKHAASSAVSLLRKRHPAFEFTSRAKGAGGELFGRFKKK